MPRRSVGDSAIVGFSCWNGLVADDLRARRDLELVDVDRLRRVTDGEIEIRVGERLGLCAPTAPWSDRGHAGRPGLAAGATPGSGAARPEWATASAIAPSAWIVADGGSACGVLSLSRYLPITRARRHRCDAVSASSGASSSAIRCVRNARGASLSCSSITCALRRRHLDALRRGLRAFDQRRVDGDHLVPGAGLRRDRDQRLAHVLAIGRPANACRRSATAAFESFMRSSRIRARRRYSSTRSTRQRPPRARPRTHRAASATLAR